MYHADEMGGAAGAARGEATDLPAATDASRDPVAMPTAMGEGAFWTMVLTAANQRKSRGQNERPQNLAGEAVHFQVGDPYGRNRHGIER
ncbi:MAG: hypothetical protein PGN23_08740 [Sphingomonas adhaesiva]|uniref:hypothetical protein n=1 Tax=Sphingomonas adhaesiva TaxID=28212 RepID=UPI002FF4DB55